MLCFVSFSIWANKRTDKGFLEIEEEEWYSEKDATIMLLTLPLKNWIRYTFAFRCGCVVVRACQF